MPYELKKTSPCRQELKTGKMKQPGVFFMAGNEILKEDVLSAIENLGMDEKIDHPVAVLSEAHLKPRIKSPSGSVTVSSRFILPEAMDAAPNCGMRLIKTDISEEELAQGKADELFSALEKSIPTGGLSGTKVPLETVEKIFHAGSPALASAFPFRAENEIENTYGNGNFFKGSEIEKAEILESVPCLVTWIGRFRLGLLGATKSHFIWLTKVSKIEDAGTAEKLGLREGQYLFFMHTGSSIVGRYAASIYTPRKIKSFLQRSIIAFLRLTAGKKIRKAIASFKKQSGEDLFGFNASSAEGQMALNALYAVNNYGFANRTILTNMLSEAVDSFFGRSVGMDLIYDAPHVFLSREKVGQGEALVHRNGANRAFGPARMDHPIFGQTGEPVLVAPFEGTPGYIGVGTDENEAAYFSANHEIGKARDLSIPREEYAAHGRKIAREMEENKLVKIVAELEPVKMMTY